MFETPDEERAQIGHVQSDSAAQGQEFKPGDHVKLAGLTNFGGYSGTITRRGAGQPSGPYAVWMVKLDGTSIETAEYERALLHA